MAATPQPEWDPEARDQELHRRTLEFLDFAVETNLIDYRLDEDGRWVFSMTDDAGNEIKAPQHICPTPENHQYPSGPGWRTWFKVTLSASLAGAIVGACIMFVVLWNVQ